MTHIGVMQVVDSLEAGGTERVAVNLASCLARRGYRSYLCAGRAEGPLADSIGADVEVLKLKRTGTFDFAALSRLADFIRENDIQILHAHSSSVFTARLASLSVPRPKVIWHDHYGMAAERQAWLYRIATRNIAGVIAVNERLAEWSRRKLHIPANRVWYVPNLVRMDGPGRKPVTDLPGKAGSRIVCVANFRPQKDHLTLVRAMSVLLPLVPSAHLLLVGAAVDSAYRDFIKKEIARLGVESSVSFLGQRQDIAAILRQCDIGVLSSLSEGLPLALLEYGAASLASVATDVGQCAEVLDRGSAGILVPASNSRRLAEALLALLRSDDQRLLIAERFRKRVQTLYEADPVMARVCEVYETVLSGPLTVPSYA